MPSWRIEISNTKGQTTSIDLIDTLGPLNEWQSVDPDAFHPSKGHFINQLNRIIPSHQPSWFLNELDIDGINVGSTGSGEILKNDGWFPDDEITWEVISEL
jgi:hypothetical protein